MNVDRKLWKKSAPRNKYSEYGKKTNIVKTISFTYSYFIVHNYSNHDVRKKMKNVQNISPLKTKTYSSA